MGNDTSVESKSDVVENEDPKSAEIRRLIGFAKENYLDDPQTSLSALLGALTLNSGEEAARAALDKITNDLDASPALTPQEHGGYEHSSLSFATQLLSSILAELLDGGDCQHFVMCCELL